MLYFRRFLFFYFGVFCTFLYLFPLVLPIVSIFSNFASSLNSSLVLEPFNPTTLKYVANKDMKAFAKDLKTIYTASDEKAALNRLDEVTKKWQPLYPHAMNRWHDNWDVITPIFKFSMDVRTAFYTTNAIESLNSCYRRLNKQRSVFPSSQALMKALYLATFEITKKWTMPIRNWRRVRGELSIMYPGRLSD